MARPDEQELSGRRHCRVRGFRAVVAAAGLPAREWTPRELRHSFVPLLSYSGMPIEDISHLVGHASTKVTESVYRKESRPVLTRGPWTASSPASRRWGMTSSGPEHLHRSGTTRRLLSDLGCC